MMVTIRFLFTPKTVRQTCKADVPLIVDTIFLLFNILEIFFQTFLFFFHELIQMLNLNN